MSEVPKTEPEEIDAEAQKVFTQLLTEGRENLVTLTHEYLLAADDNGGELPDILSVIADRLDERAKTYAADPDDEGLAPIFIQRAKLLRDFAISPEMQALDEAEAKFINDDNAKMEAL
jgi:hypothetical protein